MNTNGGTGTTLTLGAITATAVAGSLNISSTGTGTFASPPPVRPDATGTFGGKVTMTNAAGATDWAASTSAAAPFTLSNYAAYTTLPTTTTTDTTNDLATGNVTLAGAITTNSLKVANTAASQALNLGGNALTLTNGGLLATGANAYAINNGTITSGLATTPNVTLHAYGAAPLTVGATVVDSAVGPTALTKAGPGTVVLSGNSTYTGQTFLTAGTTSIATDHPLGGGNGTILIASSDPINLGPSVTLASATLPPGFGVGSTLLGSTVTAITGTSVTLSVAANTALTNQNASWANAPQVTLNGGILSASASMSLTETGSGGSTPASTANRNLAIGSGGGMLDVASGATFSVPGIISVATTNQFGPLVKTGAGTLAVAATPAVNFNITTAATVTTATVDNVTGLVVGQTITGTGIPNNATITAIDPVNKIVTLSVAATAGDGTTAVPAAAYVANSYGGATILSGGTVSTAILTNGGLNSGVGSSSAAAPALVLDGGFLQYTGSGGLTGTTNRTFTLTSNGGGLDATGNTGAVVFSNTAPIVPDTTLAGSGARTLTFTGTSTLANTLAAQIIDSSATSKTSLTKSGTGTWILSNPASTYTGNTMVTGGVVRGAARNPRLDLVDRRLVEKRSAQRHPRSADARRTLELLDEIAVVGITRLYAPQRRLLEARHPDECGEAVAGGEVLRARQRAARRIAAVVTTRADRREHRGLNLRERDRGRAVAHRDIGRDDADVTVDVGRLGIDCDGAVRDRGRIPDRGERRDRHGTERDAAGEKFHFRNGDVALGGRRDIDRSGHRSGRFGQCDDGGGVENRRRTRIDAPELTVRLVIDAGGEEQRVVRLVAGVIAKRDAPQARLARMQCHGSRRPRRRRHPCRWQMR